MLKHVPGIHFVDKADSLLKEDLQKGNLTAIINIQKNTWQSCLYH